jgi:hypothetical protein
MTYQRISKTEMQRIFNELDYWGKANSGEFKTVTLDHRHPSLSVANEPYCTYSQMISYRDASDTRWPGCINT